MFLTRRENFKSPSLMGKYGKGFSSWPADFAFFAIYLKKSYLGN